MNENNQNNQNNQNINQTINNLQNNLNQNSQNIQNSSQYNQPQNLNVQVPTNFNSVNQQTNQTITIPTQNINQMNNIQNTNNQVVTNQVHQQIQQPIKNQQTQVVQTTIPTTQTVPPTPNNNANQQIPPENKKGGNFKYFLAFIFFMGVFALIFYLPDLSKYVRIKLSEMNQKEEIITTGTLKCTRTNSTKDFNYKYNVSFEYQDNKLKKMIYTSETKGDASIDSTELDNLYKNCNDLYDLVDNLDGIVISCNLEKATLTNKQIIYFDALDKESLPPTFTELGGIYPEYELNDDIDELKDSLRDYTCQKIK